MRPALRATLISVLLVVMPVANQARAQDTAELTKQLYDSLGADGLHYDAV